MNESKVLNFIDQIESERQQKAQDTELVNSMEYKYKCLNKAKDECKKQCLSKIFEKFYRSAVPLNDDYKNACGEDLNADIPGYVKSRGFDDLVYYVGEARHKSPAAARIMTAVDNIVNETFKEKEMNLADCPTDELVFQMDDSLEKKINVC
jgi:uncharacterized protein YktA (UPF0223 family)